MSNPFDFFDRIFYINLDSRPDRKASMEEQFSRWNIKATRISAISISDEENQILLERGCSFYDDTRPEYAPKIKSCTLSHLMVLNYAKILKLKNVLILEDDALFNETILEDLSVCLTELRQLDWDVFFLGCQPFEANQISTSLARIERATSCHAYCVNGNSIDKVIKAIDFMQYPCVDVQVGHMTANGLGNNYMAMKKLATQSPDMSNIEGVWVDLKSITESRYRDNITRI